MFRIIDYCRFRLKIKRYAIFLLIGVYVTFFFYMFSVINQNKSSLKPSVETDVNDKINITVTNTSENESFNKNIAVLVLVCDRFSVTRTLDQLLKYRPDSVSFPIVLSQDCGENGKSLSVLIRQKYGNKLTYLTHPNYETTKTEILDIPNHMKGYYHIAVHYGWALNYTIDKLGYENVIIVEDDLDISPDFFEYFQATLPLLYNDTSLWCVSAYNDNGQLDLIDSKAPELLYRSDFFPGLGWMLTKDLWKELSWKWPSSFWDDWMRLPDHRKDRACIRPEISRTKTYGRNGVSNGQFFDVYLKSIKLNDVFVPFKSLDLTYLIKEKYDHVFFNRVNSTNLVRSIRDLESTAPISTLEQNSYQMTYSNKMDFKAIAQRIGLMHDFKSGVPRGGYGGIVPVMFKQKRLYLVPSSNYKS